MEFIAIDVETANADVASICQVGMAWFQDGELIREWSTLVDPEDYFDDINVSIHGIDERTIRGQPTFSDISEHLRAQLDRRLCVCHTHFDRLAIERAYAKSQLAPPAPQWLDSARVVRRAWKDLAWRGYGLANVCKRIGYTYTAHDALEDAKAAGQVLLAACKTSGLDLDDWQRRVKQPIDPDAQHIQRGGNPDGALHGEILVFTGSLEIPRREAADLAAAAGCEVCEGVSKKTTILVVGDQDVRKLAGAERSSKHRKAEELVRQGVPIVSVRSGHLARG